MTLLVTAQKSLEMRRINSWQDVAPFGGRIVAYKTEKHYYKGNEPFSIPSSIGTLFAYVIEKEWGDQTQKYSMSRVLKTGSVPSCCPLWNKLLEENPIEMRLATDSEIAEIGIAVQAKQAEFEYGFFHQKKIDAILTNVFSSSGSTSKII